MAGVSAGRILPWERLWRGGNPRGIVSTQAYMSSSAHGPPLQKFWGVQMNQNVVP